MIFTAFLSIVGKVSYIVLMILTVAMNFILVPMILAEFLPSAIFLTIGFSMCIFLTVPNPKSIVVSNVMKLKDARAPLWFALFAGVFLGVGTGIVDISTYSKDVVLLLFCAMILTTILTITSFVTLTTRYTVYAGDSREHIRIRIGIINLFPQVAAILLLIYIFQFAIIHFTLPEYLQWVFFIVFGVLLLFNTLDPEKNIGLRCGFGIILGSFMWIGILLLFKTPNPQFPVGVDAGRIVSWVDVAVNAVLTIIFFREEIKAR